MALPTLEKTWQHNVNQSTATSSNFLTDMQALMYKIKASLVGFGSTPWTVVSSSDGTSAGAADYWLAAANCVWNYSGNAHSWIVLQQSGLSNFQACIDLNFSSGNPNYLSLFVSFAAGFTGGSTTARPTATDEISILSAAQWIDISNTPVDTVLHAMQSTTGENTRLYVCTQSNVRFSMFFEKLADSGLANSTQVAYRRGMLAFSEMYNTAYWVGKKGATTIYGYTGSEYYYNTFVVNANSGSASDISSAYPMTPVSVHCETATARGRLGRVVDMWVGSPTFALAATYPATPDNKQFIQIGQIISPWNGSTPVIL